MSADKPPLLFLAHRIPFPPNKGDKIRSYHLLKYLSEHYKVFLGTFIDDENDWQYVSTVEELCEDSCFVKLDSLSARIKSLRGLLTGEALSLPYYRNRSLQSWINKVREDQNISRAVVYSSPMAQFVSGGRFDQMRRVIDFVDIDSDKWRQYAERKSWPLSWVYRREAKTLLAAEQKITKKFDASLFVSSTEAQLFRELVPGMDDKIGFYNNGVDSEYFSPDVELDNPYAEDKQVFVFTGAMDYWPNVDAVIWFANTVFPKLLAQNPQARFYIVGSKPTEAVQQLEKLPGITVTGRVEDVRPYVKYAVAAVAPMRIARGIQNKVLEAMAMEKPTLVTSQGLEGIAAQHGVEVLLADTEEELFEQACAALSGDYQDMGEKARQRVTSDFNWAENLPLVRQLLNDCKQDTGYNSESLAATQG